MIAWNFRLGHAKGKKFKVSVIHGTHLLTIYQFMIISSVYYYWLELLKENCYYYEKPL
jgi:hypothetical protein